LSNQTLASMIKDVEKARQMITRAQDILSKAKSVRHDEIAKMDLLTAKSIRVQELKAENGTELEAARAHLAEVANVSRENMRQHAIVRAEENKRYDMSTLEAKF